MNRLGFGIKMNIKFCNRQQGQELDLSNGYWMSILPLIAEYINQLQWI